ncbi:type I toxin-antitoxin system toxin Ldr family protein [Escherichia coli]
MLSLQQGGYMTLAQFCHDFFLGATWQRQFLRAGIIAAAIAGWWRNRK